MRRCLPLLAVSAGISFMGGTNDGNIVWGTAGVF
jgi:hypothetical protein